MHKRLGAISRRLIRTLGDAIAPRADGAGRLCVVNYHRILETKDPLLESEPDVATFRWQMELLASCFNVLPLYDAVQLIGTGRMPPRAVCITFDDGYRSVHDLALPILRELKLPATVFVTSGYVGGGNMWNDRIIEAAQKLSSSQLDLSEIGLGAYSLASLGDRKQTVSRLTEASKYLPPDARAGLIRRLEHLVGDQLDADLMLTPAMVVELDRAGIEIGAHTISHPILTSLTDDSSRLEIEGGKQELEAIIGKPVRLFAYPNGKAGKDFDQRHTSMAREAGFAAAFTTAVGAVTGAQDLYQLPRSRPWDRTPLTFGLRLLRWLAWDEKHGVTPELPSPAQGSSQASRAPARRVLLTAFHYPPQAASSGIQRTLSFSRHLDASGWHPVVLSASPRAYHLKNDSQMASIPTDMVVKRAFALDAKRHLGIMGHYPELLALPDRWISWWLAAVPAGLGLVRRHRPEVLWSTFPIATAHLIALTLHRLTGLPWVADFRDPMLQSAFPQLARQRKAYAWIERQAMQRCAAAVFTTFSALESYKQRFPGVRHSKLFVIQNGYDEEAFAGLPSGPPATPRQLIRLLHSGLLYDTGRDPTAFFSALASLKAWGSVSAENLQVVLRAPGQGASLEAALAHYKVADLVCIAPPLPYREALAEMLEADGLLLFQGTSFNTQVPAKLYEYFRARKPIMALVDTSGETARVLAEAGFDSIATMTESDLIARALDRLLGQIRAGSAHVASEALVAASSRAHRARQLAQVLEQVAGKRA